MPEKCILLEDTTAYKQSRRWSMLTAKSYTKQDILKGSLLIELTEAESTERSKDFAPPLNYKKYPGSSYDLVILYCKPEHVLQLNDQQFELLLGVRLPFDRFNALNILNWVENLKGGFAVNVAIPTISYPVRGIVRYIGLLPDEEGTKFGIELLVSDRYY